jgi:hypothetical protein
VHHLDQDALCHRAMIEKFPALLLAVACLALLVRLFLPARQRHRVDSAARRVGHGVQGAVLRLWRWPGSRRNASRMADDAIRRARGDVARDGNVYRPKSFRSPRKPH